MKLRSVLLAATVLALPVAAQAVEPVSGVYIGGGMGFDYLNELSGKELIAIGPLGAGVATPINSGKLKSDGGFVGLASVGYGFGNGLRVELEGNFRQNNVKTTNTGVGGGGDFQQYGAFVNGIYDFNNVSTWVAPYVGLGVGYIFNSFSNGKLYTTNLPNQIRINFDDSAPGKAAGQAIVGAAFPLGVPGLALTTEFRFMGEFGQPKFKGSANSVIPVAGGSGAATRLKVGTPTNQSFLIGLRYAFNAAPPPPPPAPAPVAAPAPAPARTYLVFFDWDKSNLTDRARQIIAEAAQNSTRVQLTQIEVSGHADTTGTAAYNMALSRRRADNVAAELVRLGVPKNVIAIQAFGFSKPLVPTGPGVREPQNRRVEIVLK